MPDTQRHSKTPAERGSTRALPFWAWISAAVIIIVLDQITKIYFDQALQYGERWHVLPFFDFTLLYNPGAAFSFLADGQGWQRWFFTAIALAAIALIIHLLRRNSGQRLFCASLTCILGGAIGNVIDRIQHGHVIDFLLFYWDSWYFPAFNIADVAITCGAILLVLDEIRRMRQDRRKARNKG
ncbi:signal peptidase II [Pusillimonas sp. MFBS29]|uniref:signal peptidase II n=1 Tax=Pusillimonas sp. MFBS29 TaxID=2886690 RepID=UPI001D11616A|nr:signal peptidase II [Pusillimonas sp. MFBS29]MCC2596739.1 signal peptidase II [Pusillimonas sp. MFBS29]